MGCRTRRPASELVRVVVVDGEPMIGAAGTGGRGAWLCPGSDCVRVAGDRRAFSRAFRRRIADDDFAATLLGWLNASDQS